MTMITMMAYEGNDGIEDIDVLNTLYLENFGQNIWKILDKNIWKILDKNIWKIFEKKIWIIFLKNIWKTLDKCQKGIDGNDDKNI